MYKVHILVLRWIFCVVACLVILCPMFVAFSLKLRFLNGFKVTFEVKKKKEKKNSCTFYEVKVVSHCSFVHFLSI